jgi:hypothetical protein
MSIARLNATPFEVIEWLRYKSIEGAMPTLFIDRIDDLHALADLETELAAELDKRKQAENDRDDLYDELAALIRTLDDEQDNLKPRVAARIEIARTALERHKDD